MPTQLTLKIDLFERNCMVSCTSEFAFIGYGVFVVGEFGLVPKVMSVVETMPTCIVQSLHGHYQ